MLLRPRACDAAMSLCGDDDFAAKARVDVSFAGDT